MQQLHDHVCSRMENDDGERAEHEEHAAHWDVHEYGRRKRIRQAMPALWKASAVFDEEAGSDEREDEHHHDRHEGQADTQDAEHDRIELQQVNNCGPEPSRGESRESTFVKRERAG